MNPFTIENTGSGVITVRFEDVCKGWEQWLLLRSDAHHDSIHCDRQLERKHFDLAKERNALIVDAGDLFDVMQGKYDPRSSMDEVRPEDVGEDYLDRVVLHAAEDYGPYAKNFLLIGQGNHDKNIRKRHGVDIISNLAHRLNADHGGNVCVGGIGGWIRYCFVVNKSKIWSIKHKYIHGGGSTEAPVTHGVIQTSRQAVYLPDADIIQNGHNHKEYVLPIKRERLSGKGTPHFDMAWFVRTPGYKFAYGKNGWEDLKMHPPNPVGCVWVRMYFDSSMMGSLKKEISFECYQDVR